MHHYTIETQYMDGTRRIDRIAAQSDRFARNQFDSHVRAALLRAHAAQSDPQFRGVAAMPARAILARGDGGTVASWRAK